VKKPRQRTVGSSTLITNHERRNLHVRTRQNTSARGSSYFHVASGSSELKLSTSQHFVSSSTISLLSIYGSKAFVGPWPLFQFFDLFTQSVGPLGRGISQSKGRCLHTGQFNHRINTQRHPWFEPTIPVFERAKTVYALDRGATVIGSPMIYLSLISGCRNKFWN
jgi:hypothetical protein